MVNAMIIMFYQKIYEFINQLLFLVTHDGSISLIIGALLGFFLENYIKRPKLSIIGGGTSSGEEFNIYHITVINEYGWNGLVFDRTTAYDCVATLYEKENGRLLGLLRWRDAADTTHPTNSITLTSGKRAELLVFAQTKNNSDYFVYEPKNYNHEIKPKIPEKNNMFTGTKSFRLQIEYCDGKGKFTKDIDVVKQSDGYLNI